MNFLLGIPMLVGWFFLESLLEKLGRWAIVLARYLAKTGFYYQDRNPFDKTKIGTTAYLPCCCTAVESPVVWCRVLARRKARHGSLSLGKVFINIPGILLHCRAWGLQTPAKYGQ